MFCAAPTAIRAFGGLHPSGTLGSELLRIGPIDGLPYADLVKEESKVIRVDGELLMPIPAHLAEKLGIQEDTKVFLEAQPWKLSISRFPDEVSLQLHIAEQVMRDNHDLLRKLAQS